jgi:hypothetical protein
LHVEEAMLDDGARGIRKYLLVPNPLITDMSNPDAHIAPLQCSRSFHFHL